MRYSIRDLFIITTVVFIALVIGDSLSLPFSNWIHSHYNYTKNSQWDATNYNITKVGN